MRCPQVWFRNNGEGNWRRLNEKLYLRNFDLKGCRMPRCQAEKEVALETLAENCRSLGTHFLVFKTSLSYSGAINIGVLPQAVNFSVLVNHLEQIGML